MLSPLYRRYTDTFIGIKHTCFIVILATKSETDKLLLEDKWNVLCEMEIVGENGDFVFGQSGCLTYSELYTTLKVGMLNFNIFHYYIFLVLYQYACSSVGPVHVATRVRGVS